MTTERDAAAAWYAELRRGVPVSWEEWTAAGPDIPPNDGARLQAGAVHLELVRRLAETDPLPDRFGQLADLVVSTPAFGRGRIDVPLPWPEASRFGTPAIAPAALPASELLRVAMPVLATIAERLPEAPPVNAARPRARTRRSFTVTGPPVLAGVVRRSLLQAGLREGGRRPTRIVLARPLGLAMTDVWTHRIGAGGTRTWQQLWRVAANADQLPPSMSTPDRVRAEAALRHRSLHVVVVGHDAADVLGPLGAELGVPAFAAPPLVPWPVNDLRRRFNRVLAARTTMPERAALAGRIFDAAPGTPPPSRSSSVRDAAPLTVAPALRAWAEAVGARLVEDLRELTGSGTGSHGYPVHGEIEEVPALNTSIPGPDSGATLDLAVEAITRAWARLGGGA